MKVLVVRAELSEEEQLEQNFYNRVEVVEVLEDNVKFYNDIVGGHFDRIGWVINAEGVPYECSVWVHDEGLLNGMPRNRLMTDLVYGGQDAETVPPPDGVVSLYDGPLYVAGDVVITGGPDSHGNTQSIPGWLAGWICMLAALYA